MDCFAEPVIGPRFARTRWLAMTAGDQFLPPTPIIARRASASPISTKAEVTSGPPTKMRVGVFILFHS